MKLAAGGSSATNVRYIAKLNQNKLITVALNTHRKQRTPIGKSNYRVPAKTKSSDQVELIRVPADLDWSHIRKGLFTLDGLDLAQSITVCY